MKTYLGKIDSVRFGMGGYQGAMFGLAVTFKFDTGCGVGDFWGFWSQQTKHSPECRWSEDERKDAFADVALRVDRLLIDAKKSDVSHLVGTPVELTTDGQTLKSWRVLTEVL